MLESVRVILRCEAKETLADARPQAREKPFLARQNFDASGIGWAQPHVFKEARSQSFT